MKRVLNEEVLQYIDFAYELVLDQTRSSYPIFTDKIKEKADFIKHTIQFSSRNDHETLLYIYDDEVEGLIQYFVIPSDGYLQLCGFNIKSKTTEALEEFLHYIQEKYKGFELYFGFPRTNQKAISFLEGNSFRCIETLYNNTMIFDSYVLKPESKNVIKVTEDQLDDFRLLHIVDEQTYWNSDRIISQLNKWNIYLYYKGGKATAAIYEKNDEIFGLDFLNNTFNKEAYYHLVVRALNELKKKGTKCMTFFNEDISLATALELGFIFVGEYSLYFKKIG